MKQIEKEKGGKSALLENSVDIMMFNPITKNIFYFKIKKVVLH